MLHERHKKLTQIEMKELITYQPPTGKAFWNYRDVKWFRNTKERTAQVTCNWWNKRFAGKEITHLDSHGYISPSFLGTHIRLHRLIWLYQTGEWPKDEIDHINGDRTDNRWENLREVSPLENNKNQKRHKNNSSGVMGIYWYKNRNKWRARIKIADKNIHLGYFIHFEGALAARKAAEIKYNFHLNHGRN